MDWDADWGVDLRTQKPYSRWGSRSLPRDGVLWDGQHPLGQSQGMSVWYCIWQYCTVGIAHKWQLSHYILPHENSAPSLWSGLFPNYFGHCCCGYADSRLWWHCRQSSTRCMRQTWWSLYEEFTQPVQLFDLAVWHLISRRTMRFVEMSCSIIHACIQAFISCTVSSTRPECEARVTEWRLWQF